LKDELRVLRAEVGRLKDESEVRKSHYKYGYYLDKCLYQEVVDIFSDHPDAFVEFLGGRYRKKEGIKRLYIDLFRTKFTNGRNGPVFGYLLDHAMMQEIIDVNEEGTRAFGRMRTLMSAGTHASIAHQHPRGQRQWWEGGVYENEYIKEDGVWKILRLRYFPFWHADFEKGWSHTKPNYVPFLSETYPKDPEGPDELVETRMMWPDTKVVPFHYPHPVTGKHVADDDLRDPLYGEDVESSGLPLTLSFFDK